MSLDDERVQFYLRNRDQIEEWSKLRGDAASAMDDWLAQLAPDVADLARRLGDDVEAQALLGEEHTYQKLRLVRRSWLVRRPVDASAKGAPPTAASVCLEWPRGKTSLYGALVPYVGAHVAKTTKIGNALRLLPPLAARNGGAARVVNPWWAPFWRVAPPAGFPGDPDSYRRELLLQLETAWQDYAERIDLAVTELGGADRAVEPSPAG